MLEQEQYFPYPSFRQHRGTQNGRKNVFLTIIRSKGKHSIQNPSVVEEMGGV